MTTIKPIAHGSALAVVATVLLTALPAMGAGGFGGNAAQVPGLADVAAATEAAAANATAVATAIAAQISEAVAAPASVSVSNVAATPTATSMSVAVSVETPEGEIKFNRFIVIDVGLKQAAAGPEGIIAPLAAMIGRILLEDIAKQLAAGSPILTKLAAAAERVSALTPDMIGG